MYFVVFADGATKAGKFGNVACTCGKTITTSDPEVLIEDRDKGHRWPDILPVRNCRYIVISDRLLLDIRDYGLQLNEVGECVQHGNIPKQYWYVKLTTLVGLSIEVDGEWVIPDLCNCGRIMGEYAAISEKWPLCEYRYDFSRLNDDCLFYAPSPSASYLLMCTLDFVRFMHVKRPKKDLSLTRIIDGKPRTDFPGPVPYAESEEHWVLSAPSN